ncbi:MAG: hypothetical protein KME16_06160 [Scytolyngbya sp. HA4215-MV1]|jgi:hypothetical protein|nr:hypothetical protein [Scytolyngbya sp. HA4215-MV1]
MITIRTMKQIPTSRTILSSRSSSLLGKTYVVASDRARMMSGMAQTLSNEARRQWLDTMYRNRII